jgi:hypothetical protein
MARYRHSNSRLLYFSRHIAKLFVPRALHRRHAQGLLSGMDAREREAVEARALYYNRVRAPFTIGNDVALLRLWHARDLRNYYLDLIEVLRCFPGGLRVRYRFGDDSSVPLAPTLVKARPIAGDHANAVLLKLDRVRHFRFVRDRRPFRAKRDLLVWRGHAAAPHRARFLERFAAHRLCDVGEVGPRDAVLRWRRPFLSVDDHLDYKFILSIEGHDVATNLKWILSSNSLCFMARPTIESWFMEGTLVPDVHYVRLADDYSDLEARIEYYLAHPDAAEAILERAHAFVAQFRDARRETLVSLRVLQRYFELSGQLPASRPAGPVGATVTATRIDDTGAEPRAAG